MIFLVPFFNIYSGSSFISLYLTSCKPFIHINMFLNVFLGMEEDFFPSPLWSPLLHNVGYTNCLAYIFNLLGEPRPASLYLLLLFLLSSLLAVTPASAFSAPWRTSEKQPELLTNCVRVFITSNPVASTMKKTWNYDLLSRGSGCHRPPISCTSQVSTILLVR